MSSVWISIVLIVTSYTCSWAWVSNPDLMTSFRWRYNVSRQIDDVLGIVTSIRMHVLDVSAPVWTLHSSVKHVCTLTNQTQPVAFVECSSPVELLVQVSDSLGMTDQFSIRLEHYIQELTWQIAADSNLTANATATLAIWLHDVLDETAANVITTHLFESGESPTITFSSPSIQSLGPVIFNAARSRWILPIRISTNPSFTAAIIQGIGVSFMTYQAKDAYIPLYIQQFAPSWSTISIPSTSPGPLRRDVCAFSTMALPYLGTNAIAFTQNAFGSFQMLSVPLDLGETLVDVAFTRTTFVVLTNKRALYSPDMQSLSEASGIVSTFNFSAAQLRAAEMCDDLLQSDGSLSPNTKSLLLFNSDSLYNSVDGGASFSSITFPSPTFKIVTASLVYRKYLGLSAVFLNGNSTLLYEYYNGSWTKSRTSKSKVSIMIGAGFGTRNSFFVGLNGVFFSPNSGSSLSELRMAARSPAHKPGLQTGESIKQLITLPTSTSYAILTTMNRVFYGMMPLIEAIEVQSGIAVNQLSTYLVLLPKRDIPGMKMIVSTSSGISSHEIPLEQELRGVRSSPTLTSLSCAYQPLTLPPDLPRYIDMGDNITFTTVLQEYASVQSSPVAVSVDDSSLIQISSSTTVTSSSDFGTTQITNSIVVQEAANQYNDRIDREIRATGNTAFSIKMLQANHACGNAMVVTRVRVGCPAGTSISVRDSTSGPISVFHQTTGYRPVIDLYRNGQFVEEMTGDYVLQEITGRTDHQYTATASQVGCIRRPQTWERLNGIPWTPQNNIDCFSAALSGSADGSDWMSASYEIVNSTGKNMLKFKNQALDGFMTFQVTVVDLRYSYCNLSTVFTIELYGRPLDTLTAILTIVGLASFMLVAFILSYFVYRRDIMLSKKLD